MAESAGELSFGFSADFSQFTRAAEGAGQTLDRLGRMADGWAGATANSLSRTFGAAASLQSSTAREMTAKAEAIDGRRVGSFAARPLGLTTEQVLAGQSIADKSGDKDDDSAKVLTHLSEQLALLRTTGTAHESIVERMKIETEQAKLGTDATAAEKEAVAGLVRQIDAATAAQAKLKAAQDAMTEAWTFGSAQAARGIEAVILDGARAGDAAAAALRSVARQGLQGALVGTGPFAALFGTGGGSTMAGGLFGALGKAVTGSGASSFAGLFASGGSIAAGQWGIAGENGAEVVAGPAAVLPWDKLPGGAGQRSTQTINFNVTTPDVPSFARSENQMAAVVARAVARGGRNA